MKRLAQITKIGFLVILTTLGLQGHANGDDNPWLDLSIDQGLELVMQKGDRIDVDSEYGTLTITAGEGYERTYTWDHSRCTRSAVHWPRNERWYGVFGIYFPGSGYHWEPCYGVSRGVLEEGQVHFANVENALKWVELQKSYGSHRSMGVVLYSPEGLLISFGKGYPRRQLDFGVYQMTLSRKKPRNLPGACETCIKFTSGDTGR